jgi:outer membrane protein assembly factor BamD (BamD/ComL family)
MRLSHRNTPISRLTLLRSASIALLLLGISGCAFWHNFSTFFNTLYLAKQHLALYEESQRMIPPPNANSAIAVQNHRWLDEEYELRQKAIYEGHAEPVVPTFSHVLTSSKEVANIHLDSAIILGSKILADKKGSKYVEDALFVVGKAQYYKNDYAGARRKFMELLYRFPASEHNAEVQVLLAHAMLADKRLDTAQMAINAGMAAAEKLHDAHAISEIHRANAELIYAKNPDSLAAVGDELRKAEEGLEGQDLAKLAFEEGAINYLNGNWSAAERAFATVFTSSKDEWLLGEAHIGHAMALRREGKFDAAQDELSDVVAKIKYSASHAAAKYELALTDEMAARAAVANNLRSPEFRSNYYPPVKHEYYVVDTTYHNTSSIMISHSRYRQAEMYREMGMYDSAAKMAASLINTKDFSTPAMNEYVSARASSLAAFAKWRVELAHADSLRSKVSTKGVAREDAELHIKALHQVLGSRFTPQAPVAMTKADSEKYTTVLADLQKKKYGGVIGNIGDTTRLIDSLDNLSMTAHYQLGRAYETFLEIPQARAEYRSALDYTFPKEDSAIKVTRAQTLYALMQLEMHDKHLATGDSLLDILVTKYGQTIYAQQARSLYATHVKKTPGESVYENAYAVLRSQGLNAAKSTLLGVTASYPEEDAAPRALYAIGVSYEEIPNYDSALVYYKRVVSDYPFSAYALEARPRLTGNIAGLPKAPAMPIDPTMVRADSARQRHAPREINPNAPQQKPATEKPQPQPNQPHKPPTPPIQRGPINRDSLLNARHHK